MFIAVVTLSALCLLSGRKKASQSLFLGQFRSSFMGQLSRTSKRHVSGDYQICQCKKSPTGTCNGHDVWLLFRVLYSIALNNERALLLCIRAIDINIIHICMEHWVNIIAEAL